MSFKGNSKTKGKKPRVAFEVARPSLFLSAHANLIKGIPFNDTVLYAHSQRDRPWAKSPRVPTKIHLNSSLVKAASYELDVTLSRAALLKPDGYESDSDLEDIVMEPPRVPQRVYPRAPSEHSEDEFDDDFKVGGPGSDVPASVLSVCVDPPTDLDEILPPISPTPAYVPQEVPKASLLPVQTGAAKTWQAVIFFLYNDNVSFSRMRSESRTRKAEPTPDAAYTPPLVASCSPKSVYRLADKLGLVKLKSLALEKIRTGLSEENIVFELFSDFTWRYPEVLEMESNVFQNLRSYPRVREEMTAMIGKVTAGELLNSRVVMVSLFSKLASW